MKKSFVLDTNVLLHNPAALESFADNEVVIPMDVIEELDRFKAQNNELGRNARQVIRTLDRLRGEGSLRDGVPIKETGGSVRVVLQPGTLEGTGLRLDGADNRIISVAYQLKPRAGKVIFVSKDINARIKSDALGIKTMDFEKEKVDFDTLYSGWREVASPGDVIDQLYGRKFLPNDGFGLHPERIRLASATPRTRSTPRWPAARRTGRPSGFSGTPRRNRWASRPGTWSSAWPSSCCAARRSSSSRSSARPGPARRSSRWPAG